VTRYPISKLPEAVSEYSVLESVYSVELSEVLRHIEQTRSLIVQAPKHVFPYLAKLLGKKLDTLKLKLTYIDGRRQGSQELVGSRTNRIVRQFEEAVSSHQTDTVFLLPYLDILTSERSGLGSDAREIFTLIHENPRIRLLAFEDPEFPLPGMVTQAFFTQVAFQGTPRDKLHLVFTKNEGRRFHHDALPLIELHRFLGGQSPIQIRKILTYISEQPQVGPKDQETASRNFKMIRDLTVADHQTLSPLDLHEDIAGYEKIKKIIQEEILDLLQASREASDEVQATSIEQLIPKGLIFYGPPGTGKTLFAQGIAHAIQGSILVVNGPELKSQWVGQGEANIRRLFAQARRQAPSVIVFDEIDSIAGKREHSEGAESSRTMVNQLLTEMDGFRPEDLVFVIGTTNLPELLDSALLRPGRFQLKLEIPYPALSDRKAVLSYWSKRIGLGLDEKCLESLSRWTSRTTKENTPYSGDHLRSLTQTLKRKALRLKIISPDWQNVQAWLKEESYHDHGEGSEGVTFKDVAGYASVKSKMTRDFLQVVANLKTEEAWEKINTWEDLIPRALLLAGPPGTGKTHLAQAIAGEWGASTLLVSAPEILSQWVGKAEQNLRELFMRAKTNPPSVIIIDEIDALARSRGEFQESAGSRSILLQLMTELSGLKGSDQVLVIGTTNALSDIDPALLRPGRFGAALMIDYPDAQDISSLTSFFSEKYDIPLDTFAISYLESLFQGPTSQGLPHSPDDIKAVFQQLKKVFLSRTEESIPHDQKTWDTLMSGLGQGRTIDETHLYRVAVHEAGHALVMAHLGLLEHMEEIRLTMAGPALGYVRKKDSAAPYTTESSARLEMAVDLGGRAAEKVVFGETSSGCESDIQQVTRRAQYMAGRWGMGEKSVPFCYGTNSLIDPVYENTVFPIVQEIIEEAEILAFQTLSNEKKNLENLAGFLMQKKRIPKNEFDIWWKKHGPHAK